MKKMALRLFFLLSIALLLGVVVNCFSPHRIAWVKDWGHYIEAQAFQEGFLLANRQSVARAVQTGSHFLLDARPSFDYDEGHIEGALSLPSEEVEGNLTVLPVLTPNDALLIYCSGYQCDDSLVLARYLREMGFTNLVIYPGGWTEWQQVAKQGDA